MNIIIQSCTESQFPLVKKYIEEFELDSRELFREQFLVALSHGELVAFGRVREYSDFSELCSLGVIKRERLKGIGKKIVFAMIDKARKTKYLACTIPEFFFPFGFQICNDYPHDMQAKLDYCRGSLPVEETYVIMKKN